VHTPFFETLMIDKAGQKLTPADQFACWTEKRACLAADRIVSSTRHHRRFMADAYRIPEERIELVPLGIDLSSAPEGGPRRAEGKFRVLYVSRLEKRKGTLTLLDAIPRVADRHPEVEFILIGSDRPHAPGKQQHREYFVQKYPEYTRHVQFLGFLSQAELEAWYRESDLFAVPSVYESFGLVYVEAMSRGLPVLGGNAGGIPEVIADGETGYLVAEGNSEQLARRILELIENPELCVRLGQAGQRRARSLFSRERMAENTERLYERVIASRNPLTNSRSAAP
jgi:glycosyltransferase involved in cell wall biosynthesis